MSLERTDVAAQLQGELFARGWALAVLFDRLSRGTTRPWSSALVTLAALAVLARPTLPRLLALAAVHLGWLATEARLHFHVHWYLAGAVHLAMLGAGAHALYRDGSGARLGAFVQSFGGVGRAVLLVALFAAGFAKLNRSFLDPAYSCAVELYLFQRERFPFTFLPDTEWARQAAVWLALLAELGAPACLLVPRLRLLGAAFASGFFVLIGLNPQARLYEFSSLFVALLFLFAPAQLWSQLRDLLHVQPRRAAALERMTAAARSWPARLTAVAVLPYFTLLADRDLLAGYEREMLCRALYAALVCACVAAFGYGLRARVGTCALWTGPRALMLIPALVLLHESTVYAGFKHMPSLSMAANLRTSPGTSNHLVVREPPKLEANRVARLLWSNDPRLRARRGHAILSSALEDYLARHPKTQVRYELDGELHDIRTPEQARQVGRRSFWVALLTRGNPARRFGTPFVFPYEGGPKGCHHRVASYRRERGALEGELRAARKARYGF